MSSLLLLSRWAEVAAEGLPSPSLLVVPLLVIIVLVAFNALFVMAEFAILGARATRMEQLAQDGDQSAATVLGTLEDPERQNGYLATAQLGITVVTLGLAMYGEPNVAHWLEPYLALWTGRDVHSDFIVRAGYFISIGLLTYLHVVLGEMIPKSLALAEANRWALALNGIMTLLQRILYWPIRFLNGIGNLLLRLFRVPAPSGHARLYSPEEIEQIVSESTEGGMLTTEAEEMIQNILDFGDRTVGQVMTPRRKMVALSCDMPRDELLLFVAKSTHSRFPVYENDRDHIVGILHLKDLIRYHLHNGRTFVLRDMLRPAPFVPEHQKVETLLTAFKRQKLHMAVVIDEFGGVAGVVTLEDLVEEVVGEVRDEFDTELEPYEVVEPGVVETAGDYLLDDLEDDMYLGDADNLPDVDTVGGLIVTLLGRPPQIGDEVAVNGSVRMRVLAIDGRAVGRARITFPVVKRSADDAEEAPERDD